MQPQQPQYTPQPAPATPPLAPAAQPVGEDPGKTLGIVSLVTSLLGLGLIGLITGIIAKKKSSAAGYKNTMALVGIIISTLSMIALLIIFIFAIVAGMGAAQQCAKLGNGTHTLDNGAVITCNIGS